MSNGPSTEHPTIPTLPTYRYHAAVVGYRPYDNRPREVRVDIEAEGETLLSLTPDEAAILGIRLVTAAQQARVEQGHEPGA